MSFIVTDTIINHYNTRNAALAYYTSKIPTTHTNLNESNLFEDCGAGPYIKTFILEQQRDKIDDTRKTVGVTSTDSTQEFGVLLFQIFVVVNFGNRDSMADEQIADSLTEEFIGGYLATANNDFIDFGEALPRQPVIIDRQSTNRGRQGKTFQWQRRDLFINYTY